MAKHSFNADASAEDVLLLAEQALRDKTEFLNRLIASHGRAIIRAILAERSAAVSAALNEPEEPYKIKAPPKRKAS